MKGISYLPSQEPPAHTRDRLRKSAVARLSRAVSDRLDAIEHERRRESGRARRLLCAPQIYEPDSGAEPQHPESGKMLQIYTIGGNIMEALVRTVMTMSKTALLVTALATTLSACETPSISIPGLSTGPERIQSNEGSSGSIRSNPGRVAYQECRKIRGHLDRNNINPNLPITNDICDVLYPLNSDDLIPKGSSIQRALGHQQTITTAGSIVSGGRFITGDIDSTVVIWDAAARRPSMQFRLADETRTILSAEMSPSGNYAATILNVPGRIGYHFPNRLAIIDVKAKAVIHVMSFAGEGFGLQFSSDDRFLLIGSRTYPGAAIWSVDVLAGKTIHGTHVASLPRSDADTISTTGFGDLKLLRSDVGGEYFIVGKANQDGSVSGRAVVNMSSTGMLKYGSVSMFQSPTASGNWSSYTKITDGSNAFLACSNARNCFSIKGVTDLSGTRVGFSGLENVNLTHQRFSPSGRSVAVVEQQGKRVGIYSWPQLIRTDMVTDVDLGELNWVVPAVVWISADTIAAASGSGLKFFRVKV